MPPSSGGGTLSRRQLRRFSRRQGLSRRHQKGHGYPFPYYWGYYPYYYPTGYYPYYYDTAPVPEWTDPATCSKPLGSGCETLNITPGWASSCFMPRYRYLRDVYGPDLETLASAIAREEAPDCPFPPRSGAASEYLRRIKLAVAVLLNAEGVPVQYPPPSPGPRPPEAATIRQPWMRAILTGWV